MSEKLDRNTEIIRGRKPKPEKAKILNPLEEDRKRAERNTEIIKPRSREEGLKELAEEVEELPGKKLQEIGEKEAKKELKQEAKKLQATEAVPAIKEKQKEAKQEKEAKHEKAGKAEKKEKPEKPEMKTHKEVKEEKKGKEAKKKKEEKENRLLKGLTKKQRRLLNKAFKPANKITVKRSTESIKRKKLIEKKVSMPKQIGRFGKRTVRRQSIEKWSKWRVPRGINIDRTKDHQRGPRKGYGTLREIKGIHPSGYESVIVFNAKDLSSLNKELQAAMISGKTGLKKRKEIARKAKEMQIRVLNR